MSNPVIVPFENKHAEYILKAGLNSEALELRPEHKKYAGCDVNTLNYELYKLVEDAMEEEEPIRL